jgi:hypothetical protein
MLHLLAAANEAKEHVKSRFTMQVGVKTDYISNFFPPAVPEIPYSTKLIYGRIITGKEED